MPMFEYKCQKCEHKMEVLEKHAGEHKHICEKCGNSDMRRVLSAFSIGRTGQFVGSCPTGTCPSSSSRMA